MNKDELRHFHRYLETEARGQLGQQHIYECLCRELEGTGLTIKLMTDEAHDAPFDIEVLDGENILVAIENKDLAETTKGTWIKGPSKRRKLAYVRQHSIKLVLTTVTLRDTGRIGFREGIVNGSAVLFDYDVRHFIERILEARNAMSAMGVFILCSECILKNNRCVKPVNKDGQLFDYLKDRSLVGCVNGREE